MGSSREWIVWGPTVLLATIVVVDLFTWQRFLRRYHQLNHEGRLEAIETLLLSELGTLRPFIRPVMAFKFPGGLQIFLCSVLYQLGRPEEALEAAQRAERKAGRHPRIAPEALHFQAICLMELGRYDEARAAAARIRSLGTWPGADVGEATLSLLLGRFDEAIEFGKKAAADRRGYVGRCMASSALNCKGDPQAALAILQEQPPDVTAHYAEKSLKTMQRSSMGRELLGLHQKQWAGVLEPLRFLYAAAVYAELKELDSLRYVLDQAGASMGGNPSVRSMHKRLDMLYHAGRGDVDETERCLAEGRQMLNGSTPRSTQAEFHRAAGRAFLALGRATQAVPEFEKALELSLHPLEKHINRFWLARAQDARGEKGKAAELFRAVVADGIPSKYAAEAALFRP